MTLIPEKHVLRNRDGTERCFTLRRCVPEDLDAVLALQDAVVRAMPQRHLFVPETREELAESLEQDLCLCASAEGEGMVMFSLMISNRQTERNLGHALGRSGEQLRETVTYSSTFVLPGYRGYGLQRLAHGIEDEEALRLGAKEALATVAPDNAYSLNNLLSCGFRILARREMYGGLDRLIVGKALGQSENDDTGKTEGETR